MDQAARPLNQLVPDHKLPPIRWSPAEALRQTDYRALTDRDIPARFQVLTGVGGSAGNRQLKRQACERCYESGRRGAPMGIEYYYAGGPQWEPVDKKDPQGLHRLRLV